MSDKIRSLANMVTLSGKVTEIEIRKGNNKNKSADISIKGEIQFGDTKAHTRKFETYVAEFNAEGKESKMYDKILTFANSNDYVSSKDKLIEGLKINAKFFNDVKVDEEFKGVADVEGYIQTIAPEVKGEEEKETGRLRVTIITTDFFGNIIPVKNIIVPADLREGFEEGYQEGQTAKLFVDFIVNQSEGKPVKAGGLGKQRVTQGKSYVEMIVTGADPAFDEDDEMGISPEAIRIALSERKSKLDDLKSKGYQGGKDGKSSGGGKPDNRKGLGNSKPKPIEEDGDIPF